MLAHLQCKSTILDRYNVVWFQTCSHIHRDGESDLGGDNGRIKNENYLLCLTEIVWLVKIIFWAAFASVEHKAI